MSKQQRDPALAFIETQSGVLIERFNGYIKEYEKELNGQGVQLFLNAVISAAIHLQANAIAALPDPQARRLARKGITKNLVEILPAAVKEYQRQNLKPAQVFHPATLQ